MTSERSYEAVREVQAPTGPFVTTTREARPGSERLARAQARTHRVLGHPRRVELVHLLHRAGGELPAARLRERLQLTHAALSQHVARLAAAGVVRARKQGRYSIVTLAAPELGVLCEGLRAALGRRVDG